MIMTPPMLGSITLSIKASLISFWPTIAVNGKTIRAPRERFVSRIRSTGDFDWSFLDIFKRWRAQRFTAFGCAQQSNFNIEV
jgi:hypothetical protein